MRIFITYEGSRIQFDVNDDDTVEDVKRQVRDAFSLGADQGPSGSMEGSTEHKILTLHHSGADLQDSWVLYDVGITPGASIKAMMTDDVKPVLHIFTSFNHELVPLLEKVNVRLMTVGDLRGFATRYTGMPIGTFRLLNANRVEMFDCHMLDEYGVALGDSVRLETWDGWNDFLYLATKGLTSHVFAHLSPDDNVARYQMKVALFVAAHFGHVDLSLSLIRQGIRADEPVGEHPSRLWCHDGSAAHIDSYKAPVHEAAEMGQLGVLRSIVHQNVCTVLAKDGNGLTPLNIALRKKQKPCASFLLTKQWSKINYTTKTAIPLNIFVKMKRWGDRAKDKVLVFHGQWKSSVKNSKRYLQQGALLGHGVLLDGFSESRMSTKPLHIVRQEEAEDYRKKKQAEIYHEAWKHTVPDPSVDPQHYFKTLNTFKLPKIAKWGRMMAKVATDSQDDARSEATSSGTEGNSPSPETQRKNRPRSKESQTERLKLPPIQEKLRLSRGLSISHQNLTGGNKNEPEFDLPGRTGYIQTGPKSTREAHKSTSAFSADEADEEVFGDSVTGEREQKPKPKKKKKGEVEIFPKSKQSDGGMPLPLVSVDHSPRPFISKGAEETRATLRHYERYRGLTSRDYAIKCLSVANRFKDKPWLHQVRQAMAIATQGVRKTITNRQHLFTNESSVADQDSEMNSSWPGHLTT